jgi:hypothetical protein
MPEALRKTPGSGPPPQEGVPVFAEEKRLPLSNAARDEFLRALEEEPNPTEALLKAAREYSQALLDGTVKEE